ncbi:MAG: hypothetical protein LBJ60_05025 [Tannerellaceae bacterium]|jgi:hypothetical protein|nr:hypothetical protein [Tannerellaceae bacterium]
MYDIILTPVIVGLIIMGQVGLFLSTRKKIKTFHAIFPPDDKRFELEMADGDKIRIVNHHPANAVLTDIMDSINKYLEKNKGAVSDFYLMKDIVDRNCDRIEEDIHTQIPMPLYLGLAGTMFGILIGIGFLVWTGSLDELLNPSSAATDANGITGLFEGVALAMITSIAGIFLTAGGSYFAKEVKRHVEKRKNAFLSWMQAELLPKLSSDATAALEKMARNLTGFNHTFSENTRELKTTLQAVNESCQNQAELMQSINKLKIKSIATANIEVYEKLKNCTDEIGLFSAYLQSANRYIAEINALHQKLDDYERRTQIIESAGRFFDKNEKWLSENLDGMNLETRNALQRFNEMMTDSLKKIQESLDGQFLSFTDSVHAQQRLLEQFFKSQDEIARGKAREISVLADEIKNLADVKISMEKLVYATHLQYQKTGNLTNAIQRLAEIKTGKQTAPQISYRLKCVVVTACILLSATCLSILIPMMGKWALNLINRFL